MKDMFPEHPSAERLQAFLDGDLSKSASAGTEEHLESCARCSSELDGWRLLFSKLGELEPSRPVEGFHDRVMAAVAIPEPAHVTVRLRDRLAAMLPGNRHLGARTINELLEGLLPARQVSSVEAHLHSCGPCAAEVDALRVVFKKLDSWERMVPAESFTDQVMAHVRLGQAPARVTAWRQAFSVASRLVPQTRQAWAALSGVAVTPVVTVGLMAYAVFSHPTLTPSSLASFAWWQITDVTAAAWSSLLGLALESVQGSGMASLFEALAAAPLLIAAGFGVYAIACVLALRVLYKNLTNNRPLDGPYAHVSAS